MVGKSGCGRWEQPEYEAALSEFVNRGLPVIPVLLPGVPKKPKLPLFLTGFTWVDFRGGITEEGLDRLEWGITGRKRTRKKDHSTAAGPRIHNLPFSSLGDLFKGRDQEIERLRSSFGQSGHSMAITQAQTLYGLGGIGKTRLAIEYAWRSGDQYDTVFFVVAESSQALRQGLANLARPGLLDLPEYETGGEAETMEAVLCWLRENPRWLLILDNVDEKTAIRAVMRIEPTLKTGHVLITSRIREWPPNIRRQSLEALDLKDAQRFLLQRTAEDRGLAENDFEQVGLLAGELGGLPLALEQAGAYITYHQISFAVYLESWRNERKGVLNWYNETTMQYPASVAATWQKTFNHLSPTAATLLRLAAFLASEPIPLEIFEKGEYNFRKILELFCEDIGQDPDTVSVRDAIAELATYSMLSRKEDTFTVHRMVQEVVRSRISEERKKDWVEVDIQLLTDFVPPDPFDIYSWPVWDLVRSHAAVAIQFADRFSIGDRSVRLMIYLAGLLQAKGIYQESKPLIQRILNFEAEHFGPDSPEIAVDLNNLARLLKATNRVTEAEPMMRRALEIDEQTYGPSHPDVATDLNNLAQLLKATNRLMEAEPLMRRALDIDEKAFGPSHPDVAIDLNNLASLLKTMNRFTEAEPMMRRALDIDEEASGPLHPDVARDLNNLARLLQDTDRLAEAEPLMRRAAAIFEAGLGPDHPSTHIVQRNLTRLLEAIGSQDNTAFDDVQY